MNWKLWFKQIRFDVAMYLSNRVIARVPSHSFRKWCYRNIYRMQLPDRSFIFMDAWFYGIGNLVMDRNSVINEKCRIDNRGLITIGQSVSISPECIILTADHDIHTSDFAGRIRPVTIGDYVFIGTRAMIMPGVTIGEGSVVAAGAVVTKDVPERTIVAGIPAKPIGKRESELDYKCDYGRLFQ